MAKESVFTMKLETDLRNQFMAEAAAIDRPASQIVREFMRDFVQRQRQARDHDAWFRGEVQQALREADDPRIHRLPDDDASESWQRQRAELTKRSAGESR
jgi:predicted transcriptional regulator